MLNAFLVGTALAQSPIPALEKHINAAEPPAWAVSCAPMGDLVEILQRIPLDKKLIVSGQSLRQRHLAALLDEPGGMEAAGIDPTGTVLMSGGPKVGDKTGNLFVSHPFAGDAAQAETLVRTLFADVTAGAKPGTWDTLVEDRPFTISLVDGAIEGRSTQIQPAGLKAYPVLLAGLPERPGCALYFNAMADPEDRLKKLPVKIYAMSMFVPTRGGTGHIRMATDLELDGDWSGAPLTHSWGSSAKRPDLVVVLNLDLMQLLREMVDMSPIRGPQLAQIKEMIKEAQAHPFQVPPGVVGAGWMQGTQKAFAMTIPVQTKRGKPVPVGKLRKGLLQISRSGIATVERLSRNEFSLRVGQLPLFMAVGKGVAVIGSERDVVAQAANGEGRPWVSEELRTLSANSGLAMEVMIPPTPTTPAAEIRTGIALTDGLVDLQIQLALPGEEKGIAGMLKALQRLRPDLAEKMTEKILGQEPSFEIKANLSELATLEVSYKAKFDRYHPAKPWPRAQDDLNPVKVPWSKKGVKSPFDELGWAPEGLHLGAYWVEVSKDGTSFTAFGALDADGDGVPAIYTVGTDTAHQVKRVTAEGVY